jgi:hypothetical protein
VTGASRIGERGGVAVAPRPLLAPTPEELENPRAGSAGSMRKKTGSGIDASIRLRRRARALPMSKSASTKSAAEQKTIE